ncbi:hypothetical protein SEA_TARGARYEN_42 [Streptomyces phage Targaryen]|nr:hypothetical protein SEA_TARGARYEN_42 [Streptomyces phage Targaryen]
MKKLAKANTRGQGACDCEALVVAVTQTQQRVIITLGTLGGGLNLFKFKGDENEK